MKDNIRKSVSDKVTKHPWIKLAFQISLVFVLLLWAGFDAWKEEHTKRMAAEKSLLSGISISIRSVKFEQNRISLAISVTNAGSPSILKNFKLMGSIKNGSIMFEEIPSITFMLFDGREVKPLHSHLDPIPTGAAMPDTTVAFLTAGQAVAKLEERPLVLELTAQDVRGREIKANFHVQ